MANGRDSITPLHLAAKWGKAEMAQLLIDKGAQLDARTRDGLTPMHTAARSGHTNVVQILLNAGASITAKTRNGPQIGPIEVLRFLLLITAPTIIQTIKTDVCI
ncbi:unnamed protein product [Rodentolepis nana]|uniref:ANK_REP_REGION domain-containing protein n=1 Tax=Rodentolepis nana TaxID=102285 RepID=A0A0R3TIN8_RODNA|nr:unnamed protein product [Rodentolepis nana]